MNQIVQTASNLHGRNSGDNRHDNGNDIERDVTGFNANSGKNQHPQSASKTNTYSPQSGAQEDRQQNYDEFYN